MYYSLCLGKLRVYKSSTRLEGQKSRVDVTVRMLLLIGRLLV